MENSTVDRKQKVTTKLLSETSEFIWVIENFRKVFSIGEAHAMLFGLKLDVEAGNTIDLPTQWQFCIEYDEDDDLCVRLILLESPEEKEAVFAHLDHAIKDNEFTDADDTHNYKVKHCSTHFLFSVLEFASEPDSLKLVDGSLILRFNLTLYNNAHITLEDTAESKRENTTLSPILKGLNDMLETGLYADIKIQTNDGKEVQAHKAILSSRSPVFFAMFQSELLEGATGVVCIKDMSSQGMAIVLKFIYTGKVDDNWGNYYEEVINAAEKYDLTLLKNHCDTTLAKICTPENAWHLLKKARQFGLKQAQMEMKKYIKTNFDALMESNLE